MEDNDKDDDNNKDNNDDKGISALGLHRDLWFLRGHQGRQGHRPHDDDDDNEEEDNNKEDENNKDDNAENGISAQRLDRDLGFSRGHQGRQGHRPHDDLVQIRVISRRFA